MALIRWEPARELQSIQQEMNRLFGTFFDSPAGGNGGASGLGGPGGTSGIGQAPSCPPG